MGQDRLRERGGSRQSVSSIRSTSTAVAPQTERQGRDARPRATASSRSAHATPALPLAGPSSADRSVARFRKRSAIMSGSLNADASVPAVTCANQVLRRFPDLRVVLEEILRLDSDDSVPGMQSRHGRTTLLTDDFWNVRHTCTTADSNSRVSVAAARCSTGH